MRKSLFIGLSSAGLCSLRFRLSAFAADAKTVTITGEGKCAKCALKETDKCQNVIQTKEDGKTVTYYVAKNDVSDGFPQERLQRPREGDTPRAPSKKSMARSNSPLPK